MASLRWVADGIEAAEAAGGVTLDKRRRTGFEGGIEVRPRSKSDMQISGFSIESDPEPYDDEEDRR